jgi:hypothetical protein
LLINVFLFRIIQILWSQFTRFRVNSSALSESEQSLHSNEIVVSYTEAVDRYPLLKLHISTEP